MLGQVDQFLVEIDEQCWLCTADRICRLDDPLKVAGPRWWVTDFNLSISRTMTIEADFRYVELMVSRRLQETGEFDEPVTVITHWKKRNTKNSVDIFFTAVPSRVYSQYMEMVRRDPDHLLLVPLYQVLYNAAKSVGAKKASAVVFAHGRFADLLVASGKQVFYARRIVAYDTSQEQINSLWESVVGEIMTLRKNLRLGIDCAYLITWLDSHVPIAARFDEDFEWRAFPPRKFDTEDGPQEVSLLETACSRALELKALPLEHRLFYAASKMVPRAMAVVCATALLLFASGYILERKADATADRMKAEAVQIRRQMQRLPKPVNVQQFLPTVEFLENMRAVRNLPSIKGLVDDLSQALSEESRLLSLKADYKASQVEVEIFGRINASFEIAFRSYQKLLDSLKNEGYLITGSRFDTLIRHSEFMIRFSKKVL